MQKKVMSMSTVMLYVILIPFLLPLGFTVYSSAYNNMVSLACLTSVMVSVLFFISKRNIYIPNYVILIISCSLELLLVTLYSNQGHLQEGFRKLFFVPALCVILTNLYWIKRLEVVKAISNIFLITMILNVTIFSEYVFPQYFIVDRHITFLGHVQIIAMIGVLEIFLGYLRIKNSEKKIGALIIVVAVINMLYSKTDASYVCLSLLVIFTCFRKSNIIKQIIIRNLNIIFGLYVVFNFLIIYVVTYRTDSLLGSIIQNHSSGRGFIWQLGLPDAINKLWIGYGAYGIKMAPFWTQYSMDLSSRLGFNYAHNTLLQLMLDGGLLLLILALATVLVGIRKINKIKSKDIRYVTSVIFCCWLVIATVESVVEYYYVYIFLMLVMSNWQSRVNVEDKYEI